MEGGGGGGGGGGERGVGRERGGERGGGGGGGPKTDLALLGILAGVALAVQVAVELSPRQLAGITLHLKILGSLLGDKQEILEGNAGA